MKSITELAIIILNWNAAEDTLRCVRTINDWQEIRPTLWVVDNASTDGSPERIACEAPYVRLIRNATNQGFAGGNNRALEAILAAGDPAILLLNNDAHIEASDVMQLLTTLETHPDLSFVGPLLYSNDDPPRLLSAGGRSPIRHHHAHIANLTPGEPVRIVEYVPGTVLLIRASTLRRVGLLDERYFFSTEIADLCMRAARYGYRSAIDARSRAIHAIDDKPSGLRQTLYVYYIIRNRFILIRNLKPKPAIAFYGAWTLYSLALSLKLLAVGKSPTARAVWLGLLDGLHGRFGGQNARVLAYCGRTQQHSL